MVFAIVVRVVLVILLIAGCRIALGRCDVWHEVYFVGSIGRLGTLNHALRWNGLSASW